MKNVYLFQPQYSLIYNKSVSYWLPYSIGCIWAYAHQFDHIKQNFHLGGLYFKRDRPEDVLATIKAPSVCGFSCYVWNEKYCLEIAKQIKKRWPECLIVFGGEQVTNDFLDYDYVDSVVKYEGEENFLKILECILDGKPVPSTFSKTRLNNLNIPSPYTTGLFDNLIKQYPDAKWNMTLETNRGCPFKCTFCNWGSLTQSKVKNFDIDRIQQELEWCIDKPVSFLTLSDANFGILKERDLEIAHIIKRTADAGEIDGVSVQYTKNSNETVFQIAKVMDSLSRGVTVSVQSMNKPTLEAIKRTNLKLDNMKSVMRMSREYGVKTYSEMILGLPLETIETWKNGLCELLSNGQHDSIDVWLAQLLQNSELAEPDTREKYGIKSVIASDYVSINNYNYWEDIPENIEIINFTNTMSTEEMAESYMYAWMIIHFHITGYSQIYSRYLNNMKKINYRDFYDRLFKKLKDKECFINEHFDELYSVISSYLHTGELNHATIKGHNLISHSSKYLFENRNELLDITKQVCGEFINDIPYELKTLQENFLLNLDTVYPLTINFDYNINHDWQKQPVKIVISSRMKNYDSYDFYSMRRQNLIRNDISVVECPTN